MHPLRRLLSIVVVLSALLTASSLYGSEPIRVIVVIGDGSAGECGETAFGAGACEFNGAGNTLKCR